MCIRLHGWREDLVVMDPFLGIGSSAIAAVEAGVARFIGSEIDKTYLSVAQERLQSARNTWNGTGALFERACGT